MHMYNPLNHHLSVYSNTIIMLTRLSTLTKQCCLSNVLSVPGWNHATNPCIENATINLICTCLSWYTTCQLLPDEDKPYMGFDYTCNNNQGMFGSMGIHYSQPLPSQQADEFATVAGYSGMSSSIS